MRTIINLRPSQAALMKRVLAVPIMAPHNAKLDANGKLSFPSIVQFRDDVEYEFSRMNLTKDRSAVRVATSVVNKISAAIGNY